MSHNFLVVANVDVHYYSYLWVTAPPYTATCCCCCCYCYYHSSSATNSIAVAVAPHSSSQTTYSAPYCHYHYYPLSTNSSDSTAANSLAVVFKSLIWTYGSASRRCAPSSIGLSWARAFSGWLTRVWLRPRTAWWRLIAACDRSTARGAAFSVSPTPALVYAPTSLTATPTISQPSPSYPNPSPPTPLSSPPTPFDSAHLPAYHSIATTTISLYEDVRFCTRTGRLASSGAGAICYCWMMMVRVFIMCGCSRVIGLSWWRVGGAFGGISNRVVCFGDIIASALLALFSIPHSISSHSPPPNSTHLLYSPVYTYQLPAY